MNRVCSSDGTLIAYEKLGNGQPVILVDGALCSRTLGPMSKLAPVLAKRFNVFLYDRRGRGDSSDTVPYSPGREVEDIEALIKVAGGSAFLFGISSGAVLAIRAVASGLPVGKLALFEPPFMVDEKGHHPPADHETQLKALIAADRRSDAVKFYLTKMIGAPAVFVLLLQLMPMWKRLKDVAHTLPYDAAIMGDFSLPAPMIASLNIPTLIAGGAKSPLVLRHSVEAVAKTLPNGTYRMLEGQTHNVNARVIAPVLADFFVN